MLSALMQVDRDQPLHIYDGIDWAQIQPSGNWPPSRIHFGMAYDASRNVVVVFGGFQGGFDYLGDTWEWDGTQWEEKFPEHSPEDTVGHFMTYCDSLMEICLVWRIQRKSRSHQMNYGFGMESIGQILLRRTGPSATLVVLRSFMILQGRKWFCLAERKTVAMNFMIHGNGMELIGRKSSLSIHRRGNEVMFLFTIRIDDVSVLFGGTDDPTGMSGNLGI